ncbi:MAG: adenosylmethionine--8-amino-7-oxononanoate transaminase [Bacteroidetes bacterium]|nr:adenosylmethionine--8-amino-7-oxononanoate transaminase [Bacteroidota bacterium]
MDSSLTPPENLWYPYVQMKNRPEYPEIVRAEGCILFTRDGRELIDVISSWWSVIHGYNHPALNKVLVDQANRFSHVMLGGLTHQPAQLLAAKLAEICPGDLNHVFFSDSGSVAVEVAVKMAIQFHRNQGNSEKRRIISLSGAYHGDTFKTMELGDDSDFTGAFSHVLPDTVRVNVPKGGYNAEEADLKSPIAELQDTVVRHHPQTAALIVEPILQCAGGFRIYSPAYLDAAREICDRHNVLLIYDEVATGFGRTGRLFAANHANAVPDIMVIGKALTAGYLGHAATIASNKVYRAFLSNESSKALMHGPTYMGNPLACAVAFEGIRLFQEENYLEKINHIHQLIVQEFEKICSEKIVEKRAIGGMGVIEVKSSATLSNFRSFAIERGVWIRPFASYLYVMPAYVISDEQLLKILRVMREFFD